MSVRWRRIWILVYEIIVMLAALAIDLAAFYFVFVRANVLLAFLCATATLLFARWGNARLKDHIREWG